MHAVLPAGAEKSEVMNSRMTIAEATAALDAAIARHKAAERAAAEMYCDVIRAREALDAAFAAEDETLPQCVVAAGGFRDIRSYKMVIVERNKDHIRCRYIGDRGGFVTFKWNAGEEAYIATRGCAFDRNRRIVAIDGDERLREPTKQDSEASS